MMMHRNTRQAARELGRTYHQLMALIRYDRIPEPRKDMSGNYAWFPEDIERAREALKKVCRGRPRKQLVKEVVAQ